LAAVLEPQNDRSPTPTDRRSDPDRFQLPAIKIEANLGFANLISNTAISIAERTGV